MQPQQYYFLLLGIVLLVAPFAANLYFKIPGVQRILLNYVKTYSVVGTLITLFVSLLVSRGDLQLNTKFTTGLMVGNIPIELCLFIFAAPFASIALYELINNKFTEKRIALDNTFFYLFAFTYFALALIFAAHALTSNIFLLMAILMIAISFFKAKNVFLTKNFYIFSIFSLITFIVVALILTGSPFITHTKNAVTGFYLGSIPFEQFFFAFFVSSVFLTVYYSFKKR